MDEPAPLRQLLDRLRAGLAAPAGEEASLPPLPEAAQLSPLTLAYVGDAVYELYVRTHLLRRVTRGQPLHRAATELAKAVTQARVYRALEPELREEERAVARRGRNAGSGAAPKSASVIEYRNATALECLFGHLLLAGEEDRLLELLRRAVEIGEQP